jgi:hypothetical protein
MANRFGPWASSIDVGGNPQLSAFWRQRLTRLAGVIRTNPALSWNNFLWLVATAALVLAVPMARSAPATAEENGTPATDKKVEKPALAKPSKSEKGPKKKDHGAVEWKMANGKSIWETPFGGGGGLPLETVGKVIAEKRYEFLRTFLDNEYQPQYVYRVTLSNGDQVNTNFPVRLENLSSLEDYKQKWEERRRLKHERIDQALVSGKFRLINLEIIQIHVCRDPKSKQKFEVQRFPRSGGNDVAFPRADLGKLPASVKETSWKEHLDAIHSGDRELLELRTLKDYTYEMIADDGTNFIFSYGGGEPLKKASGDKSKAPSPQSSGKPEPNGGASPLGPSPKGRR